LTKADLGTLEALPPTINEIPSLFKAAKKHDEDNPTYYQAVHGKHEPEYREAMDVEINALENGKTWTEVLKSSVPSGKKILPLTWIFKLKRFPDGSPRKFKARLCVRGDLQREGVDYFEKYAPVVAWSTVRMLLTLTAREGLKTRMVDFTNAFAQADLEEELYVQLPPGSESKTGEDTVLRLNKSLYGLVQAPLSWYTYLCKGLDECGFTPSQHDPCLFYNKEGVMVLVYVDDCIFFGKDIKKIDEVIEKLRKKFALTVEEVEATEPL
jgi:hypothetical protein